MSASFLRPSQYSIHDVHHSTLGATSPITAMDQGYMRPSVAGNSAVPASPRQLSGREGSLFGLKIQDAGPPGPQVRHQVYGFLGVRSYDYKEKYQEDVWGAEMHAESRFYKTCIDESEIFDMDRFAAWRDALDVLLVIIGLFSAIVATFLIETLQALQPDYTHTTAVLVYNILVIQQTLAPSFNSSSSQPLLAIQNPGDLIVQPSQRDIWVNALWFSSLAINLSAALIAVLAKQWLYRYMSPTSGTSQERARLRQFRLEGLEKYRVPMIIDLLPVGLHLSMALFLVGLALLLSSLHTGMSIVVSLVTGVAYSAYLASMILPLLDPQCPYQSPISGYLFHVKGFLLPIIRSIQKLGLSSGAMCLRGWVSLQTQARASGHMGQNLTRLLAKLVRRIEQFNAIPPPSPSLQAHERHIVSRKCHQLDVDAITWLYSTSSNSTVRDISFQAVVGLTPSDADTSRLKEVMRPYYQDSLHSSMEYNYVIRRDRESNHRYIMQAACIDGFQVEMSAWRSEDVDPSEVDGRRVFNHSILPSLYGMRPKHRKLDISSFLAPGPRYHIHLPLSVWRLCIQHIGRDAALDPVLVTRLLVLLPAASGDGCDSPATFVNALTGNTRLQRMLLGVITQRLGIPMVSTFNSPSLLLAILNWALPRLVASHSLEKQSQWGSVPEKTALSLLAASFKAYAWDDLQKLSLEIRARLVDACTHVLSHRLSFDSPDGWRAYYKSVWLLWKLWDHPPPQNLLHSLLEHLALPPPLGTNPHHIQTSCLLIPKMIEHTMRPAMFYDILRERDELPLSLCASEESRWALFRGWDMCRVAVFAWQDQQVDSTADWAVRWIRYIDCPERLFFIFKQLLVGEPRGFYEMGPMSLLERVAPLLQLTEKSSHWAICFERLALLLKDQGYIMSICQCDSPRRQLSDILINVQERLAVLGVDLSMHVIARFDASDSLVCSPDAIPGERPLPGRSHTVDSVDYPPTSPARESRIGQKSRKKAKVTKGQVRQANPPTTVSPTPSPPRGVMDLPRHANLLGLVVSRETSMEKLEQTASMLRQMEEGIQMNVVTTPAAA